MIYPTRIKDFTIREAEPGDCEQIVAFIKALAEFEKFTSLLTLNKEKIYATLFENPKAYCLIGEVNGTAVCFSIYFYNYSILTANANMHIEALFTPEEYRSKGYGSEMMRGMTQIAIEKGCLRVDWACLKWNTEAIRFYKSIGAYPLDDRDTYRMDIAQMREFAMM